MPYAKKMRVFLGGRGNIDELPEKLATQCKSKKNLRILLSHGQDIGHIGLMSKRVVRNELFGGGIYKAVEELTLTNLRAKR